MRRSHRPIPKRRLIEVVVINRLLRNGNLVLACNLDLPRHGLLAFAGGYCNYGCFTRRNRRNVITPSFSPDAGENTSPSSLATALQTVFDRT